MQNYVALSTGFLDKFLAKAKPVFVWIYIALLFEKLLHQQQGLNDDNIFTFSVGALADKLGLVNEDIIRAVKYWENYGVLSVLCLRDNSVSLSFDDTRPLHSTDYTHDYTHDMEILPKDELVPKKIRLKTSGSIAVAASKPVYSTREIDYYLQNNSELRALFKKCENHMGKLLSYNDMCVLFSFHDWLRMSFELIELLVEYCCNNEHRSIKYIESVAVTWFDAGITTIDDAKARIKLYNKDFRQILHALGKHHREPVKAEADYMLKWLKLYKIPLDVVLYACEKTVLNTTRPTFGYVDTMLESWHNAGVLSVEDAKEHDKKFKEQEKYSNTQKSAARAKKSRFNNFKERDADLEFDEIKRLEAERIAKELED